MKTILIDGHSVEVSDAAEIAISNLTKRLTDADAKVATLTKDAATVATDHAKAISERDAKIATQDAEIATLKAAQVTDADLDKRVADRAKLISDAKKIGGDKLDVTGPNADIKKRAVLAALGDTYKDKDAAFFDAAFELQLAGKVTPRDTMRDGIMNIDRTAALDDEDKALDAAVTDLNAWRNEKTA